MNTSWLLIVAIGVGGVAPAVVANGNDPPQDRNQPAPAHPWRIHEFPDGEAWTIEGGLAWAIGRSGAVVFVPQGFVHDKGSVPPVLWSQASYTRAAVVHDYLYWAQPCTRLQADNLLMIAMKQSGTGWLKRRLVYQGVRLQGESVWKANAEQRAMGLPRLNPYGHVPDNLSWPQLRARMFREGVRDVRYLVPDHYCRYGDRQDVPGWSPSSS